jgi:hypothetical protein
VNGTFDWFSGAICKLPSGDSTYHILMPVAFELQRKIHHELVDSNRIPLSTFVFVREMITLGSTHVRA